MTMMTLGAYTFEMNPQSTSHLMTPVKRSASLMTYDSIAYFSWGTTMKGKNIALRWDYCPVSQYEELQTLFESDVSMTFNPQDDGGLSYTVEVTHLSGQFFNYLSRADWWRQKVELGLLFLSEGS